jgi:hypothetical protein
MSRTRFTGISRLAAIPSASAVLLLLGLGVAPAMAQSASGRVDVVAIGAEDGAPIPLALVRLLPGAGRDSVLQQGITGTTGRFIFTDVPAGDYRIQLLRIGHPPAVSAVLRVRGGETIRQELRGTAQPVPLPAVAVVADERCLAGDRLPEAPHVATLWEEARKGVELRLAFELHYRFVRERQQVVETRRLLGGVSRSRRADTLRSEPDSVLARHARRLAEHRSAGFVSTEAGTGRRLYALPEETELLDPAFLRDHCLEAEVAAGDGAVGLRFRPVGPRTAGVGVRGTLWIEDDTFLTRRLELEYLEGERVVARSGLEYADIDVGGSALRLPARGQLSVEGRGGRVAVTYVYRDVKRIADR